MVLMSKLNENLYTPRSIRTYTGLYVNVFEPTSEMLCIQDIAWALSKQPRFGGHLPVDYSVGMHCLNACDLVSPKFGLSALMHDASEAYLLDIPSPIKGELVQYKSIELNLMRAISSKFKFEFPLPDEVKEADKILLEAEWNRLMIGHDKMEYMDLSQMEVYETFLYRFETFML